MKSLSTLTTVYKLYFTLEEGQRILKYDLVGRVLSVIKPPPLHGGNMVLVTAEDGGLGTAAQGSVIKLDMMNSIAIGDPSTKLDIVGFAEGAGSIFINTNDGIFTVELKSGRVRKIGKRGDFCAIFPFISFDTTGTSLLHIDIFHQS
uniref:Uncharacterized protein n=1 Tax=Setaria viridis TaxID=4556 RepID=A0A4U6T010_SETVI|nr:hypothetical protein SEVIR_9G000800v2 [Setaria viridis]